MSRRSERHLLGYAILAHVIVWTVYPILTQENLSTSGDMAENFAWGREWQLGYFKHPPLFAWIAAAWFKVLPRADWAYFLLSAANTAIGLVGVYMLVGLFGRGPRRLASVLLLAITPLYGFMAIKFNANAVLLSIWPWFVYVFLKTIERPTVVGGLLTGVLAGVAMMGKYFSGVLLIAAVIVVLIRPDRWRILLSPAALAVVLGGLVVFGPHLVWLKNHDFGPIAYAGEHRAATIARFLTYVVKFPFSQIAWQLPLILALLAIVPRDRWAVFRNTLSFADPARRAVLVFWIVPFVVAYALGILVKAELSSVWGIPLWFLTSWALLSTPGLTERDVSLPRLATIVAIFYAGLIAATPLIYGAHALTRSAILFKPEREFALEVTRIWHDATGRPLRIVGGLDSNAHGVLFYSPDTVSELIDLDLGRSPWIAPDRLDEDGVLVVCRSTDQDCQSRANTLLGPNLVTREVTLARRIWGLEGKPYHWTVLMRLPRRPAG